MRKRTGDQPGVLVTRLTKSFGAVRAVDGIDLAIAPGETVALLGPNGAGKTTTIDMVLGLLRPDDGEVSVFGMPPADAVRAGRIGGMLQTGAPLDHLRVRELVELMGSYYPRALPVDGVLRLAGATEFAEQWTTKLSGGQVQRLRFAAAIVGDPDLLVLDEPTAAIDVEGRQSFWQTIREFAGRGRTVVFATHYLEEADAFADRIIVMARGRIVAQGTPQEVKARVGARTIRATVPRGQADPTVLGALPGVVSVQCHGDGVTLSASDSDAALRRFLQIFPDAHGIEVRGGSLEEAFLELTADSAAHDHAPHTTPEVAR